MESRDDLAEKIGALSGRLGALEGRMDRHENYIGARLSGLEAKNDARLSSIESKIDGISTQIAMQRGGAKILGWIWPFAGGAVTAWIAKHFT